MIGIKDMKMPTRCVECPIYRDVSDLMYYCPFAGYMDLEELSSKRDESCPLFEINLKQEDDEACCADSW